MSTADEDAATEIASSYLAVLRAGMDAHPRSAQKRIGPSEIGVPCSRALIHKLHKDTEPPRAPGWKPAVGTALHTQVEEWFNTASQAPHSWGRWLTEQRVSVGVIGGEEITGSTDLWDEWSHTVIDHKFIGPTALKNYRANGPSAQYRAQAHLYGRGWVRAGKDVRRVMIAFVPRDGELSQSHFWSEPYDPAVAADALSRANHLLLLSETLGKDESLALFPPCDSPYCPWCAVERAVSPPGTSFFTTHH